MRFGSRSRLSLALALALPALVVLQAHDGA